MRIDEVVANLNSRIQHDKVFDYPEVVFVAHSLGGLIVQRLLLTHREYAKRVPFIYFFSTPQTGSQIANLAHIFSSDPLLAPLKAGDQNDYLRSIESDWRAAKFSIKRYCAYETKPIKGTVVVDRDSATRNCSEEPVPINEDHIGIVKPCGVQDDSYVALFNAVASTPIVTRRPKKRAPTAPSSRPPSGQPPASAPSDGAAQTGRSSPDPRAELGGLLDDGFHLVDKCASITVPMQCPPDFCGPAQEWIDKVQRTLTVSADPSAIAAWRNTQLSATPDAKKTLSFSCALLQLKTETLTRVLNRSSFPSKSEPANVVMDCQMEALRTRMEPTIYLLDASPQSVGGPARLGIGAEARFWPDAKPYPGSFLQKCTVTNYDDAPVYG